MHYVSFEEIRLRCFYTISTPPALSHCSCPLPRQFALTFQPSSLEVVELKKALFDDAPQSKMKEVMISYFFHAT